MQSKMRVAVFSAQSFEKPYLLTSSESTGIEYEWIERPLTMETVHLARGCEAVAAFVLDDLSESVLSALKSDGVGLVCLRAAGFNNLDVHAGHRLGMAMARAAAYSPNAVAEHAVTLLLSVIRKPCVASARLKTGDGRLDGLLGFDLQGKTVGVVGTGRIGSQFARIMRAFGCHVLAYDVVESVACLADQIVYTDLDSLLAKSDIVSLHCLLCEETRQLLDAQRLQQMKRGSILINTARGDLVDTQALIQLLTTGHLAGAGLDVVEHEASLFFADHRAQGVSDSLLSQLLSLPNVMVTPHQAFFTVEALMNIAQATVSNILGWREGEIPFVNRL